MMEYILIFAIIFAIIITFYLRYRIGDKFWKMLFK